MNYQPAVQFESPAMHSPNPTWTSVATGGSNLHRRPARRVWQQAFAALRAPVWPAMLAVLCAAGLLLAFQQIVHAGVLQGEARNRATAAYAHERWRCNFTRGVSQSASCHAQLNASRHVDATLNAPAIANPAALTLAAR